MLHIMTDCVTAANAVFSNLEIILFAAEDLFSSSEQKIKKLPVVPTNCLKFGRPMRKKALRSVSRVSLLLTVRVVTLASFAISERFFLGSSLISQIIFQSVPESFKSQGGR